MEQFNMESIKKIFNKHYPITTRARKVWVVVISIVIPLIVLLIISNLAGSKSSASQERQNDKGTKKIQMLATQQDVDWYNKPMVPKERIAKSLMLEKTDENHAAENSDSTQINIQKAMEAPISTGQTMEGDVSQNNSSPNTQSNPTNSKVKQDEQQAFLAESQQSDDYLQSSVQAPKSNYELQAGSIIPATLITGINSDLPGQIIAQVTENVYDSISGNNLLIPQGTRVIGVYDSKVSYGQERVLIAWKRLIWPDGKSLDLEGMPGVDVSGYAGFNDQVDNHYSKIFGSVILMSFLSAGAQLSQPQNNSNQNSQPTVNQMLAQSLGTNLANTGNMMTQKNVNIQPTLEIRPGYQFNLSLTQDMVFQSNYA